jgi:hypothetical protein
LDKSEARKQVEDVARWLKWAFQINMLDIRIGLVKLAKERQAGMDRMDEMEYWR